MAASNPVIPSSPDRPGMVMRVRMGPPGAGGFPHRQQRRAEAAHIKGGGRLRPAIHCEIHRNPEE
jgi:hypothetical protein